jgi:hypothetical protein
MNSDMITGAVRLDYLPVPERSLHGTMPFNPSQGLGKQESKLLRALKALPFLAISAAAVYFMWGVSADKDIRKRHLTLIVSDCASANAYAHRGDNG